MLRTSLLDVRSTPRHRANPRTSARVTTSAARSGARRRSLGIEQRRVGPERRGGTVGRFCSRKHQANQARARPVFAAAVTAAPTSAPRRRVRGVLGRADARWLAAGPLQAAGGIRPARSAPAEAPGACARVRQREVRVGVRAPLPPNASMPLPRSASSRARDDAHGAVAGVGDRQPHGDGLAGRQRPVGGVLVPAHLPAGAGLPEDEVGGPRRAGPGPDPGCVSPVHRSFTLATGRIVQSMDAGGHRRT